MKINWEYVRQEAFTAIRINFSVETLIKLEAEGNYTPASGDALAKAKAGL